MKYIDSDKLIAEIKRLDEKYRTIRVNGKLSEAKEADLVIRVLHNISITITSLQQEQQPSLPSNLDETAEKIAWDIAPMYPDISWDKCFEKIKEGIKAGAEWMAGQFQKIEGELVDWYSSPEGKDYCCGVKTIDSFEVPEGFYIRKK